jgi:anti-sigma factor (TIGR02949 family)
MSPCAEWQNKLDAYLDAELSPPEMEAFRVHASECSACAVAALASVEMKASVRRAGRRYAAPSELRARVLNSMHKQPHEISAAHAKSPNVINWPRWAMAAAAVLLLAAGLFFFSARYQRPSTLSEFADLHVANLASSNPVEVVSTDRHTVKPWFQGRIPFTFDLPDLQGSPFTLVGGRVTYFHQEPGAHLLFAYQKHDISAFIFREMPQLGIRESSFSDRGTSFNLQTWTQDGLRYVLVSDVNAATLQQLASRLQHN